MKLRGSRARWRATQLAVLAASLPGAAAPVASAGAPQPFAGIDVLGVLAARPTPQCGALDDPAAAQPAGTGEAESLGPYGVLAVAIWVRPVVAVCDPERRAAQQPGRPFSGTLVDDRVLADHIGPGFRQLSAPLFSEQSVGDDPQPQRGGGLVPGDRITIAPSAASSTLSVALLAGSATSTVTFERWADPAFASTLTIVDDGAGRTAVLERGDGMRQERRVTALTVPTPTITVTGSGTLTRVTIGGLPAGGALYADVTMKQAKTPRSPRAEGVVGPDGSQTLRLRTGRSAPADLDLAWSDFGGRRAMTWHCTLRGARATLAVRRCTQTLRADGTGFASTDASAATHNARAARAAAAPQRVNRAPRRAMQARAARLSARAPRLAVRLQRLGVPQSSMPIGDLNGDGRAEFTDGALWLSGPHRSTAPAGDPFIVPTAIAGDLTLDGQPELLLQNGWLALSRGRWTTATLPTDTERDPIAATAVGLASLAEDDDLSGAGPKSVGATRDVTGDGRPEAVLIDHAGAITIPSELLHAGTTQVTPSLAFLGDEPVQAFGDVPAAPLVANGMIYRLAIQTPATRSHDNTTFVVEQLDARGAVQRRSSPLSLPGVVGLRDHDPISGDLMLLSSATACHSDTTSSRTCFGRVFRLRGDGTLRATARLSGDLDSTHEPMFGPDGPDADSLPEIVLPNAPTTIMPSAATGQLGAPDLPVLTVGGRPLNAQWRSDQWSTGQVLRAFPVEVIARHSYAWRGLTFAPRVGARATAG